MDEICNDFHNDIETCVPKAIAQEILTNLFNQKASGQFCDVQFLHGSATVWAHSCVLASYSPFMMRLFCKYAEENKSWSFNKPMQVNISLVSKCNGSSRNNCVACTCKIIDFIYTGKIKLDAEHLDHVVNLSNNLELDVLLLICQRYKRDHFKLLDSLAKSNQISTGNSCKDIVDVQAYVDNLNDSISTSSTPPKHHESNQHTDHRKPTKFSKSTNFLRSSKSLVINEDLSSLLYKGCSRVTKETCNTERLNHGESDKNNKKFEKEYVCTACNFKSTNSFNFKQHKRVFHKRNYVCLECDFTSFKMAEVMEHLVKSSHGGKTCSICLFEAETSSALQSHFNDHSRSYPFRCTICKQRFKYRNDWVRHKYSPLHVKELNSSTEKLNTNLEEEKSNFACRICKHEYNSTELLQKHNHIFHKRKYVCLSCEFNSFKIESIIEHLIDNEHEENVCSICLYIAKSKDNFKYHVLDHKNSQPFACSVCRTRFQTRNEWWRHELAHGSDKPFKCKLCELSFQTSSYLKTHILYRHKPKKHTCKVCGYDAPFASKLVKHSLTHKNKYQCKIGSCTFNCSSEVMLKKHKKVHSSKLLSCPVCSLSFKFVKNMKRHIKLSHNPKNVMLTCPSCGYSNTRMDKMKDHCKNHHPKENAVLEIVLKQYEEIKKYQVPDIIKKQRQPLGVKNKNSIGLSFMKKENYEVPPNKKLTKILDPSTSCENNLVSSTLSDSLKQTVLLSEATSELNILCENEGKPIPVASVTSTNMLTIGNFREGTGSMTLNETTGVLTLNNINVDSKGAVFLNESTGVLSYINLNIENPPEVSQTNEEKDVNSEQVQLNEVTGEIITVIKDDGISNKTVYNAVEEDFQFDTFGIDFNEDSCDGFDDFDSIFFDTFLPFDSSPNVEEILKCNSNELFGSCEHITHLDEMTGELTFDKNSLEHRCNVPAAEDMWSAVDSFSENSIIENVTTEVYESLLNEVTGEFS